jgi:SAM-dependent methyltransferase
VVRFINEHAIKTVVDLGCGDFRVGRRICSQTNVRYIGIDIVPALIAHHQANFSREGVEFRCANIIQDELPDGELCLIRQVLQHLSNREISCVLSRLNKYGHLLVTEDVYHGSRTVRPNLDHLHGPDNRVHKRSGVFLDLPPYSLASQTLLEVSSPQTESVLRTLLIRGVPISG